MSAHKVSPDVPLAPQGPATSHARTPPAWRNWREFSLCLFLACAAFLLAGVRYAPQLSYFQGLSIDGVLERAEYGRAKATLHQLDDPWRPIEAPLHKVIGWRLLFPVVWHYGRLPPALLLAMPVVGCLLVLGFVAHVAYSRTRSRWTAFLATMLMAALPWNFVSTGWLLYFDSWFVLGALVVAFAPSHRALVAACLLTPWIDERFLLALPVALTVRAFDRYSRTDCRRRDFLVDVAAVVVACAPYLLVRSVAWLGGDPASSAYVAAHLAAIEQVPWKQYARGLWSGFRAGWLLIAAAVVLAARRWGPVLGGLLAAVTLGTAVGSVLIAMDMSRSLMMLCPVLLWGVLQCAEDRLLGVRALLPAVVALNLLLPATHTMWNQEFPIASLPVEMARWRDPPSFFEAARLLDQADRQIRAGDAAAGSQTLDRAIALSPHYPGAFVKRASLRMSEGKFEGVRDDLDEALRLDAVNSTAYFLRGVVGASQGAMAAAAEDFQQALRFAPADWPARAEAEQFLRESRAAAKSPSAPAATP